MNNIISVQGEIHPAKCEKILSFELLRIIAVFCVIFNHTNTNGFMVFTTESPNHVKFWIYMVFAVICKVAVPIFMAISGAVLLGKPDEPLKQVWLRRILKYAVILLFFSAVYYVADLLRNQDSFSLKGFVSMLYGEGIKYHLWYLYLFIAYLAVLPFLRSLVRNLDDKYFIYMIVIAVFFQGILPSYEYYRWGGLRTLSGSLKITWLTNTAVLYPCIGYYLRYRVTEEQIRIHLQHLWDLNVLGIFISCFMTFYKGLVDEGWNEGKSQSFLSAFVVLNCITLFLTFRALFDRREIGEKWKAILYYVSGCTFGIYLWHPLIKDTVIYSKSLEVLKEIGLDPLIVGLLVSAVLFLCAGVITAVHSRIPFLRKLVGF